MKFVLLSSNRTLHELLGRVAAAIGHECVAVELLSEVSSVCDESAARVVLVDLNDSEGFRQDVCEGVRAALSGVELFVIAHYESNAEVLPPGADDFIADPCDGRELNRRLAVAARAMERRATVAAEAARSAKSGGVRGPSAGMAGLIVGHLPSMVLVISLSKKRGMRVLFAGGALTDISGFSAEDFAEHGIQLLIGPDSDRRILDAVRNAHARSTREPISTVFYRHDGTSFEAECDCVPVRRPRGDPQVVVFVHDVSERAHSQAESLDQMREAAISEAAGSWSREMIDTLTPTLVGLHALEQDCKESDAKPEIAKIRTGVEHAMRVVNDVGALNERDQPRRELVALNELVREVVTTVRREFDRRITVDIATDAELEPIWVLREHAIHIVKNILFTARDRLVQELDEGVPTWLPRLWVETAPVIRPHPGLDEARPRMACQRVTIRDNGAVQAGGVPCALPGGLSNSAVMALAREAGVWMEVEEDSRTGRAVQIFFPEHDTGITAAKNKEPSPEVPRILLAEDHAMMGQTLYDMLRSLGLDVAWFHNGLDALEELRRDIARWDILVADLNMPVLDGRELIEQARKAGFDGRIVVITGFLERDDESELERMDVERILLKPVSVQDLKEAIGLPIAS